MAQLDKETIKYLSTLSRIKCTEEEQEALLHDLKEILEYMEQLNEVNTDNVAPCRSVLEGLVNVMRDDIAGTPMSREEFLANAPSHVGGMIRVPPVLKSNN